METQVTQRVESAIRGITGVDEISSSIIEGNSTTFVQFQLGTPTDRAVNDVRNAIAQIRSNLPDGILEPQVERVDAENEPISYVGAQTTDMTLEQLSWYIDNTVAKRLLGHAGHRRRRARRRSRPRHPRDPRSRGAAGAGHYRGAGQPAASPEQHERRGRPRRDRGFRTIGARARQRPGRLRAFANADFAARRALRKAADLGEVRDSNSEQRSIAKMDGRQVVTFMIQRAKGASEVTAYDAGWKELKKLEKENPKVHFSEVFNTVDYTKAQYRSAMEGLIEGAILAVFVVLLFLRDIRATAHFGARHPAFGHPRLLRS